MPKMGDERRLVLLLFLEYFGDETGILLGKRYTGAAGRLTGSAILGIGVSGLESKLLP